MDTVACVDICHLNTGTLANAFQFGTEGDTTWSFTGMAFEMEVKASREDTSPLLTLTSTGGTIVVDDEVERILHLNVSPAALQAALPCAEYVYDLVMIDASVTPNIITPLMQGKLTVSQGVTGV